MELILARAGLADNDRHLTSDIIREVVETFEDVKEAPVTLGHKLADYMPAFGWVKRVWTNKNATLLFGEVDLLPPLKEAYEAGFYRKWSVGIKRRLKDGKHYFHHLAFLGAVPPAIKGLSVIKMSEGDKIDMFEFSEDNRRFVSYAKTDWPIAEPTYSWDADAAKRRILEKGSWELLAKCCGAVEIDKEENKLPEAVSRYHFPFCDVIDGKVKIVPKAVSSAFAYLHGAQGASVREELARIVVPVFEQLKKRIEKQKEEMNMADIEALKKENEQLKAKIEELEKKLSKADDERKEFSDIKGELERLKTEFAEAKKQLKEERIQKLRAAVEGKLPKESLDKLLAFAETLPEEPIEFSDGDKKEKKDPLEVLAEIFSAIPKPIQEGMLRMADVKQEEDFDPTKMAQNL